MKSFFIGAIAVVIAFSAVAKGAHDIWAATAVYTYLLLLLVLFIMINEIRIPLVLPSLILIGAFSISYVGAANPSESFLELMDWAALLTIFYLSVNIFKTEADVTRLCLLLVPVFLIEFAVVSVQWVKIRHLVSQSLLAYEEPVGTFVNGNSTVSFCLLWLPLLWAHRKRWYVALAVAGVALVLLMVSSAWSLVCLVCGLVLYAGHEHLRRWHDAHRLIFWTVAAVLVLILGVCIWYKLALIYGWGHLDPGRLAPTSRLDWWRSGFRMWRDHPWFGIGLGNFPSAYLAYKTGSGQNTLYAHSAIVQLVAETGLVGFGAVLLFIASCFYWARAKLFGPLKPVTVGLFMFLLFSAMQVSFEYLSHLLALGVFLGALLASTQHGRVWIPRRSAKIIAVGLGLTVLPFLISPFFASRLYVDGTAYAEEKNWTAAEKSFHGSIKLDSRAWEPYWGLAQAAVARGDFDAGIRWGEEAVARNKLNLRLKEALEDFKRRRG